VRVIEANPVKSLREYRLSTPEFVEVNPEVLLAGVLCNDAQDGGTADPTELALLRAALAGGVDAESARAAHPRADVVPFDGARIPATRPTLDEAQVAGRCLLAQRRRQRRWQQVPRGRRRRPGTHLRRQDATDEPAFRKPQGHP
jgi:hypothetical protein